MSKRTIISAFLGGAAVGAASLLFAPKKGSELRQDAQEKLVAVKEKVQTTYEKYRNQNNQQEEKEAHFLTQEAISEQSAEVEEESMVDNPSK